MAGLGGQPIRPGTLRLLMNAYFSMLTEIVLSDAGREDIIAAMTDIQYIYQYGIMGLIARQSTGGTI